MERAFLTRLDHQLFIAPATYASTYFELCSLVPSSSEEALRRQLHRMTELAGACFCVYFLCCWGEGRGVLIVCCCSGGGVAMFLVSGVCVGVGGC
jgi:hypothetical protein